MTLEIGSKLYEVEFEISKENKPAFTLTECIVEMTGEKIYKYSSSFGAVETAFTSSIDKYVDCSVLDEDHYRSRFVFTKKEDAEKFMAHFWEVKKKATINQFREKKAFLSLLAAPTQEFLKNVTYKSGTTFETLERDLKSINDVQENLRATYCGKRFSANAALLVAYENYSNRSKFKITIVSAKKIADIEEGKKSLFADNKIEQETDIYYFDVNETECYDLVTFYTTSDFTTYVEYNNYGEYMKCLFYKDIQENGLIPLVSEIQDRMKDSIEHTLAKLKEQLRYFRGNLPVEHVIFNEYYK